MSAARSAPAAAAVLLLALGAGCAAGPGASPPDAQAVYQVAPRTVRPGELATARPPARDGDTVVEIIGLTTGLRSVLGSHAEWPAKGQFVRLRVAVTNAGNTSVPFDTARQLLLTADGQAYAPDSQAMLIKRQPGRIDVGAGNRFEFDLYYDVPVGVAPTGLRVFGGPTLADFADTTGVDLLL